MALWNAQNKPFYENVFVNPKDIEHAVNSSVMELRGSLGSVDSRLSEIGVVLMPNAACYNFSILVDAAVRDKWAVLLC
uniref:Uncharacterized protein n=1 Tax=Cannabis sativa TaxID=3483 RepID=A0A803P4R2_CANSA